jgi:hypothetical protein
MGASHFGEKRLKGFLSQASAVRVVMDRKARRSVRMDVRMPFLFMKPAPGTEPGSPDGHELNGTDAKLLQVLAG